MVFTREGGQFAYAHEWDSPARAKELGAYVAATLARKGARHIIAGVGLRDRPDPHRPIRRPPDQHGVMEG